MLLHKFNLRNSSVTQIQNSGFENLQQIIFYLVLISRNKIYNFLNNNSKKMIDLRPAGSLSIWPGKYGILHVKEISNLCYLFISGTKKMDLKVFLMSIVVLLALVSQLESKPVVMLADCNKFCGGLSARKSIRSARSTVLLMVQVLVGMVVFMSMVGMMVMMLMMLVMKKNNLVPDQDGMPWIQIKIMLHICRLSSSTVPCHIIE